jgi:hypothetical protein
VRRFTSYIPKKKKIYTGRIRTMDYNSSFIPIAKDILKIVIMFSGAVLLYLLATYLKEWVQSLLQTKREKDGDIKQD